MSATAFQRRRRELAKKANEEVVEHNQEVVNDSQVDEQTAAELNVEELTKEQLFDELKARGINKPANTGIKKLREALNDVIN